MLRRLARLARPGASPARRLLPLGAALLLAVLVTCRARTSPEAAHLPSVRVEPSSATVVRLGTQRFSAVVQDASPATVTWRVQEPEGGSVDATGLYTAPASTGTFHVVATSVASPGASGSAEVAVVPPADADPTGLAPAERLTTWDPGIPGGLPTYTSVHTTIDAATFGDGVTDALAAINGAIAAAGAVASAASPQVVYLPPGTYRVGGTVQLDWSHVVLRGAGPALTRIVSRGGPALLVGGRFDYQPAVDLVADAPRGSRTLQVASAATFAVGDVLQLDQEDGPASSTGEGHLWNGYLWMGDGHYSKRQPGTSDIHGPYSRGTGWVSRASWLEEINYNALHTGPWRSVAQQVEVAGRSGNTLTLTDPLHLDFTVARAAQVFETVSASQPSSLGTRWSGVEELALAGGTEDNFRFVNTAYCWLRHVESDGERLSADLARHPGMTGNSVGLLHAYRCVVRDSYVHHARSIVNGGGAYGIALEDGSSANLVENNVVTWLNKPIVMNVSGGGNVVAYNYVDNAIIAGTSWQESAIDGCHQAFSHSDLFEGNWAPNLGSDSTHGSAGFHVFFRNHATGRNSMPYDTGGGAPGLPTANLRSAGADALSREHTFLGNVLTGGTVYQATPASHSGGTPIYRFGDNGEGGVGGSWDTGQALSFAYRNGNWDDVTGGVVWDPATTRRDLPPSLYLTARPAFFGALPWPWVDPLGPTAADRVKTLPARARFDAGSLP